MAKSLPIRINDYDVGYNQNPYYTPAKYDHTSFNYSMPMTTTISDSLFRSGDFFSENESTYTIVSLKKKSFNEIDNLTKRYIKHHGEDVDVESITLKDLFDFSVIYDPESIEYVPQTVERCTLALKHGWKKSVKDKITLPFTGEMHRQYMKLKLIHGNIEK